MGLRIGLHYLEPNCNPPGYLRSTFAMLTYQPWPMHTHVLQIVIRPLRITLFIAFLMGCVLSSYYSLGPVFILTAIIATIFANLGTRGEGQLSAYSIFNPGVRRLPGQLDADEVDRQMRQGQM